MTRAMVHIAGAVRIGVQRCTRCGAIINGGMGGRGWIEGNSIRSDGDGMSDISVWPNLKPARDCGKAKAEASK